MTNPDEAEGARRREGEAMATATSVAAAGAEMLQRPMAARLMLIADRSVAMGWTQSRSPRSRRDRHGDQEGAADSPQEGGGSSGTARPRCRDEMTISRVEEDSCAESGEEGAPVPQERRSARRAGLGRQPMNGPVRGSWPRVDDDRRRP